MTAITARAGSYLTPTAARPEVCASDYIFDLVKAGCDGIRPASETCDSAGLR